MKKDLERYQIKENYKIGPNGNFGMSDRLFSLSSDINEKRRYNTHFG